nr:MAG TPA: hypothetical protein [Caudoviricetes sp.]
MRLFSCLDFRRQLLGGKYAFNFRRLKSCR